MAALQRRSCVRAISGYRTRPAITGAGVEQEGAHTTTIATASMPIAPVYAPAQDVERSLLDGVTIDRPLEAVPTLLTNVVGNLTGRYDERYGRAGSQILLAGAGLLNAGLQSLSHGSGVIATGSSVVTKVLPTLSIGLGAMQVWKGWQELDSHDQGVLSLIHSRTARSGMLQVVAGALNFIPGVGSLVGSSVLRIAAAANELDAFDSLDWPTSPVEEQGHTTARIAHPLDRTPTDGSGDRPLTSPLSA